MLGKQDDRSVLLKGIHTNSFGYLWKRLGVYNLIHVTTQMYQTWKMVVKLFKMASEKNYLMAIKLGLKEIKLHLFFVK